MQAARRKWQAAQPALDITKLIFLDETGASTNMARRDGHAPRGERGVASVPHGHWHTTTFVAGLRHGAITAPMVADGAMTGALFLKYVHECLARYCTQATSSLRTTYVGTKWQALKRPLKRSGHTSAIFRRIPQNPIKKRFATLNALFRKAAPRTVDALWADISMLLDRFTPAERTRYFASSGYVKT